MYHFKAGSRVFGEGAREPQRVVLAVGGNGERFKSASQLRKQLFPDEVPRQEEYRYDPGRNLSLDGIASAIASAEIGAMRDLTDLGRKTIDTDPNLASALGRRFGQIEAQPWQLTPASGEGIDRTKAAKIADIIEHELRILPAPWPLPEGLIGGVEALISDLAWGLWDGRSSTELVWTANESTPERPIDWAISKLLWVHPRRLNFGPKRELRFVDYDRTGYYDPQGFYEIGINTQDYPGKFVSFMPRMFGEYPEREGLNPRAIYWSFFKRFSARERMVLSELFGKPWKILETDVDAKIDPAELARIDEEVAQLGIQQHLRLAKGMHLNTPFPPPGAGEIYSMTVEQVNQELNKLVLGQTMTSDDGSSKAQGQVHERQQDIILAKDARMISSTIRGMLVCTMVYANAKALGLTSDKEVRAYTPEFRIVSEAEPDRTAETERMDKVLQWGVPLCLDEVYEISGYKKPAKDDETVEATIMAPPAGIRPVTPEERDAVRAKRAQPPQPMDPNAPDGASGAPFGKGPPNGPGGPKGPPPPDGAKGPPGAKGAPEEAPDGIEGAQGNYGKLFKLAGTWEGAARRLAFDPMQPRDDVGRWTEDGKLDASDRLRPAATAERLTLGKHVGYLEGLTKYPKSARLVHETLSTFPIVASVLSRAPILSLTLLSGQEIHQMARGIGTVGGLYDAGEIALNVDAVPMMRAPSRGWGYGGDGQPMSSVPEAALSDDEYKQAAFIHEVGHHLDAVASDEVRREIRREFDQRTAPEAVTVYSATNAGEWFAESFALYNIRPTELRERDSGAHRMVERALVDVGALTPTGQVVKLAVAPKRAKGDLRDAVADKYTKAGADVFAGWAETIKDQLGEAGSLAEAAERLGAIQLSRAALQGLVEASALRAAAIGAAQSLAGQHARKARRTRTFAAIPDTDLDTDEIGLFPAIDEVSGGVDFLRQPWTDIVDAFATRRIVKRSVFDTFTAAVRKRAFTVAGLAEQRMLETTHDVLTLAIDNGTSQRDFIANLEDTFVAEGWTPLNPWHAETVFRTNVMSAYADGRKAQMKEVSEERPFGVG